MLSRGFKDVLCHWNITILLEEGKANTLKLFLFLFIYLKKNIHVMRSTVLH